MEFLACYSTCGALGWRVIERLVDRIVGAVDWFL